MIFMIFFAYLLFFLLSAFFAASLPLLLVFMFDSVINGHDLPTSGRATEALAAAMRKYKPDARNFYDLGCARGALSLRLKKIFPRLEIYGVDNGATRIFFAKLKSGILRRKVNFQKQDIFNADLRGAEIVYAYLWYDLLPALEKKLQEELKQGALVITNASRFRDWQPAEKIATHPEVSKFPDFETLFVYVKK